MTTPTFEMPPLLRAIHHVLTRCKVICENLNRETFSNERGPDCSRKIEAETDAIVEEATRVFNYRTPQQEQEHSGEQARLRNQDDAAKDLHAYRLDTYLPVLHTRIMNLPCTVPDELNVNKGEATAYKLGHRDARHAAAELGQEGDRVVSKLRTVIAAHYGADYVENLLRADRLVRHYVNGLVGKDVDAAAKATQDMVDYVMLKSPVSLSVLAHAADCDLLKPTVIETANSTRYVARNCTCGALERSQAEPKNN